MSNQISDAIKPQQPSQPTEELAALTLPELLESARAGNRSAWSMLMQRLRPLVYGTIWKCGIGANDANDIAQSVWLTLWHKGNQVHDPAKLAAWTAAVARNAAYKSIRTQRRLVIVDFADSQQLTAAAPDVSGHPAINAQADSNVDDNLCRIETVRAIRHALAELSTSQQQLLAMLVADPPIPYREISRRTGLPVGSIGPTRARLLNRLARNKWVRQLVGDPEAEAISVAA